MRAATRDRRSWLGALAILVALPACGDAKKNDAATQASTASTKASATPGSASASASAREATSARASASAREATSARADGSAAPTASASASGAGDLARLFEGPPSPGTLISDTVTGAGGVYAGLAQGWETSDVYNAYLIASSKKGRAMAYLVMMEKLETDKLDGLAKDAAYPIFLKDIEWAGPWVDAAVGPSAYKAHVRRGSGGSTVDPSGRRAAVAVAVEIPSRKPVFILGSWNEPDDGVEKEFVDLVRGLGRCVHKPQKGCVPVEPTGDEKEIASPPRRGPANAPF